MTANYSELRDEIQKSRTGQARWRCPKPLREKVTLFAQEQRHRGVSIGRIAKGLGLSETGLGRWLRRPVSAGFRPVRVADESPVRPPLVLVTPSGYRLEGLSTSSAAEVLRSLER